MRRVAVTGVNGFFAHSIVPALLEDPEIEHIVGIDVTPPRFTSDKISFHHADVRDPGLGELLEGVDTVVHLAFIVAEIHDKQLTHDINVGGTRNLLAACAAAVVRKVVLASSVAAYGSHADNPIGMTEEQPLRPNPDSYYSTDKAEAEAMIGDFARAHPEMIVTVLRPPIVVGPAARFLKDSMRVQARFGVRGRDPQVQWLHEDDLGTAFRLAVSHDLPGVFNVAPDDSISMSGSFEILGLRPLRLPAGLMKTMANLLFRLHLLSLSRGWVSLGEHSCVMSNRKLKDACGWRPRYGSAAALADFARVVRAPTS